MNSDGSNLPGTVEPMSIGRLLDRSFRLLPVIFGKVFPLYIVIAALMVAVQFAAIKAQALIAQQKVSTGVALWLLSFGGSLIGGIVLGVLFLAVTLYTAQVWTYRNTTLAEVVSQLSFGYVWRTFWRFIGAGIWIGVATMLWMICLILPGLIYAVNRYMTYYIIILEDAPILEALSKSKFLMTRDPWYSMRGAPMRVTAIILLTVILSAVPGAAQAFVQAKMQIGGMAWLIYIPLTFVSTLLTYLLHVYSMICYVGLYYDLRARYEAIDLLSDIENLNAAGKAG